MTSRPLRILYLTKNADRGESAMIIGIHQAGHDVRLIANIDSKHVQRIRDAGVPVTNYNWEPKFDRGLIRKIRRDVRDDEIDIIHSLNGKTCMHMVMASKGTRAKLISYLGVTGNVSWLLPGSWIRFLNRRVDRIVCVAEGVRQYLLSVRFLWLHLDPRKVITIHKGHRLEWYNSAPVDRAELGVPSNAMLVTCSSRLRKRKGLKELILALGETDPANNIHVLFLGHEGDSELHRSVARLPHPERVHFAGFREDGPAVMAASDVCALPVLRGEGLSRAVIEAMVYEVTPLVTDVGGNAELVVDGECGVVVPPGDVTALAQALDMLYSNPAQRREFGRAARERIAREFRSEDTIERTLELYREVLAEPNRAS